MLTILAFVVLLLSDKAHAFWRLPCNGLLSTERLDPIVSPGAASGHVHAIAGGSALAPTVTYDQLRNSTCSSCLVLEDMSLYWTPNLWTQWSNGSFSPVPQIGGMLVYYLQRGNVPNKAFPAGLRMLAGNPFLRSYNSSDPAQEAITYTCLDYTRNHTYPQLSAIPSFTCQDGLRAQVFFPSCWDGVNLDSSDHKSHMAYPSGVDNGDCPSSHPVRLISLFYEVTFDTWSLEPYSSEATNPNQPFVFSMGDPTGYGFHGDFINGWDVDVLQNAVDNCTSLSGVIQDCPAFTFAPDNAQCHKTPFVNEIVTGMLPALPGCNPVTQGPASAGPVACSAPQMIANATVYQTPVPPVGAVNPGGPSVVLSGSGYSYAGCYPDNVNGRLLPNSLTSQATGPNGLTPASCLATCNSAGYSYCGLEYGQECWAGNNLGSTQPEADGNCAMTCTGNSSYYCGAGNFLTLYDLTQASSAVSATPSATSTTVAVPSASQSASTSSASSIGAYTSIGCMIDQGPRTLATSLTQQATSNSGLTPQSCISACTAGKYQFCGFEYGQECWAANYMSNTSTALVPSSQCNMPCSGDNSQFCGAGNRLTTYQNFQWTEPLVTNPGVYGASFIGCYTDNTSARTLQHGYPGGSTAICVQNCISAGYSLAGTEYSGQCYCDNSISNGGTIAAPANDPYQAQCNMACSSNSTEACGGPNRLNVYRLPAAPASSSVTPTPTSAAAFKATSSSATSTTAAAPPATQSSSASNAVTIGAYTAIGCMIDQGPRTLATSLTQQATTSSGLTPQSCISACTAGKYQFCGFEYGQECWAANYMSNTSTALVPSSQCNMPCTGDKTQLCGAGNRLTTYENMNWQIPLVTNPGVYGASFAGCYTDNTNARTLQHGYPGGSTAICVKNCISAGYSFAGTEYGGQCYCDNSINNGGSIAAPANNPYQAQCNMACSSNSTEACGGPNRLNVYRLPASTTSNAKTTTKARRARAF